MIFANMGGLIGEIFTWGCRTGLIEDSRGTFKLTKGFKAAQKISKGRPSSQELLREGLPCAQLAPGSRVDCPGAESGTRGIFAGREGLP